VWCVGPTHTGSGSPCSMAAGRPRRSPLSRQIIRAWGRGAESRRAPPRPAPLSASCLTSWRPSLRAARALPCAGPPPTSSIGSTRTTSDTTTHRCGRVRGMWETVMVVHACEVGQSRVQEAPDGLEQGKGASCAVRQHVSGGAARAAYLQAGVGLQQWSSASQEPQPGAGASNGRGRRPSAAGSVVSIERVGRSQTCASAGGQARGLG
jgi:hypothetical protein